MENKNRATRRGKTGMVVGCLALACLALGLFAAGSWAGESVKIGALLTDPSPYNLRLVTVEGVVSEHQLNAFKGNYSGTGLCYQHFKVADETGAITVFHPSFCMLETQAVVVLRDGDRVIFDAHFTAPMGGAPFLTVKSVTKIAH